MIQGVLNDGNNIFLHMYYAPFFLGASNIRLANGTVLLVLGAFLFIAFYSPTWLGAIYYGSR